METFTASVQIRSFFGPYFPAFELNMQRDGVSLLIQSNAGKYRPEKAPYLHTFHGVFVSEETRKTSLKLLQNTVNSLINVTRPLLLGGTDESLTGHYD